MASEHPEPFYGYVQALVKFRVEPGADQRVPRAPRQGTGQAKCRSLRRGGSIKFVNAPPAAAVIFLVCVQLAFGQTPEAPQRTEENSLPPPM